MKKLNIIISVSCQNDHLEALSDDIRIPKDSDLNMSYEGCELMWTDYFNSSKQSPYSSDILDFIAWLRDNMFIKANTKGQSYERVIEKYRHRAHIDSSETDRFWQNGDFETFIKNVSEHISAEQNSSNIFHLVHLRKWFDISEFGINRNIDHLGIHCLKGTHGARFVKPLEEIIEAHPQHNTIANSNSLSSFKDTDLDFLIRSLQKNNNISKTDINIGIVGVVTNIKIFLLVYELMVIYGFKNVFVCEDFVAAYNQKSHIRGIFDMRSIFGTKVVSHKEFNEKLALI